MEFIGAEVSHKIRSAIKAKLMELGAYVDEELPDYIMVMVANKRAKSQMDGDLQLFLGSNTTQFTSWLYQVLQKLQEVTVGSLDKKTSKSSSNSLGEVNTVKRKSTLITDNEGHRKEKRRKSSEGKKSKKGDLDKLKDKSSLKPIDIEKHSRPHNAKDPVTSSRSETGDSVVSSSADGKTNKKSGSKDKDKFQAKPLDTESAKRNSNTNCSKLSLSNGNSKSDEKGYLSRLRAEALRSRDVKVTGSKTDVTDEDKQITINNEDKLACVKLSYTQPPTRTKIVLMNSDDEDDDEDFINIKADAEAEQLLKEELPREALEANVSTPETTPVSTETLETIKVSCEAAAGDVKPSEELPTIPLKEDLVPKRPASLEEPMGPTPPPAPAVIAASSVSLELPGLPLPTRLLKKRLAEPEPSPLETKLVIKEEDKSGLQSLTVKDRLGAKKPVLVAVTKKEPESKVTTRLVPKTTGTDKEKRSDACTVGSSAITGTTGSIEQPPKQQVASSSSSSSSSGGLLSRVVMMRDSHSERRNRLTGSGSGSGGQEHSQEEDEEEEEYDPSNPAVGTVASVVRVKPRPKIPAALQANKTLILKAVAEAQKSVASIPVRTDPTKPTVWKRTGGGFVRKLEHVGITLPTRRMKARVFMEAEEMMDEDLKPDATRIVSDFSRGNQIVIRVSSDKLQGVMVDTSEDATAKEHECDALLCHFQDTEDEEDRGSAHTEDKDGLGSGRAVYPPVGLASRMPCVRTMQQSVQQHDSPQFLVTLDGLDPNMFRSQCDTLDGQICSKEDFDLEMMDIVESPDLATPKRTKTPIVYKVESTDETTETSSLPKSLERCKYWPSCRLGTKCSFHHPVTPCKSFPKCPFGDKCLYIHPFCKFNSSCTRRDCPFVHASPRTGITAAPRMPVPRQTFTQVCRFFPKCSNAGCRFLHPKACRYGKFCSKQDCNYIHQDLPSVDKLKWTSPFKT